MALEEEEEESPIEDEPKMPNVLARESWIYTYGDMVTLLLAFFVILFANSSPETEKFRAISSALRGGPPASPFVFDGAESLFEQLRQALIASELLDSAALTVDDRGVTISLNESILFARNSSQLTSEAREAIQKFTRFLYVIPNSIVIEGHTDGNPRGLSDSEGWAISSARAASVAAALEELGIDPIRMESVGYSASRPKVSNETPQGQAINRRVDILIKSDDGP